MTASEGAQPEPTRESIFSVWTRPPRCSGADHCFAPEATYCVCGQRQRASAASKEQEQGKFIELPIEHAPGGGLRSTEPLDISNPTGAVVRSIAQRISRTGGGHLTTYDAEAFALILDSAADRLDALSVGATPDQTREPPEPEPWQSFDDERMRWLDALLLKCRVPDEVKSEDERLSDLRLAGMSFCAVYPAFKQLRADIESRNPQGWNGNDALRAFKLLDETRSALSLSERRVSELQEKADAYDRINTPEIDDFLSAVRNEALHQRERWKVDHDGGKEAADWFWLLGYLAGKALHDVKGKRLHHLITAAASLLNWHGQETGNYAAMRPGIDPLTASSED